MTQSGKRYISKSAADYDTFARKATRHFRSETFLRGLFTISGTEEGNLREESLRSSTF